tara:strand:+ start:130 stop:1527 length:1398 start_codon:yes stop_codon:yes gene_type:complete
MVSISFGKSNFSEAQNSYQMTVALIMMFVVLCSISSIIVAVKTSSSQEPVPIKKQGTKPQGVTANKQSKVKITNDGVQFPKPSTTEGYLSESVSCKKLRKLEPSAFENGSMNGFSDYDSYESHRIEYNSKRWGENGYCNLMGLTDENQNAIGYFHHEGDYKKRAFNSDTGKCKFTDEDKPYACVYKEEKDGEFITGFKNNEGKRLEVMFYNDYKAGKLDKWFEDMGLGTKRKFILNDENKLEISLDVPEEGISGSFLIQPGNNYPVQFMLLGSAIAMVDNNIPMAEDGIDIRFTSLNNDDMKKNYSEEMSKIIPMGGPDEATQKRSNEKKYKQPAYIKFYTDCSKDPVTSIEIDRNTLSEDIEDGPLISNPGQKIKRIELGNITILGTSEYTRYKEDAPNREDVGEQFRPITCFNGGCEKLATVKVLGNPYYDDESVFLRDGNCNSPTDYYKDIKFNYKITKDDP